jgi:glutaredoxin
MAMDRERLHLVLYTRPGCHLCEDLKALCERMGEEFPIELTEVNIDDHPALRTQYDQEIPVLVVDGRKAVKYRTTAPALRRLLQRRSPLRQRPES